MDKNMQNFKVPEEMEKLDWAEFNLMMERQLFMPKRAVTTGVQEPEYLGDFEGDFKICGSSPIKIDEYSIEPDEMMYYQYLPIKMIDSVSVKTPPSLHRYSHLIGLAYRDYLDRGGDHNCYIYITMKVMFTRTNSSLNREGWHADGFMSDDINYIWSDALPTEYIEGYFKIPEDHKKSLEVFEKLGKVYKVKSCEPNVLYRLDESVIHRVKVNDGPPLLRQFMKISFSKDKYNLKGNSHNYAFDYKWEMKQRNIERNHPNKL